MDRESCCSLEDVVKEHLETVIEGRIGQIVIGRNMLSNTINTLTATLEVIK